MGCATHARLAISSVPEGANLTDSITGEDYGIAPMDVYFNTADIRPDSEGCFYLNSFEVRWVSGAAGQTEPVRICGSKTGTYQIVLSRPSSYPGLEQDMEWALQIQQELAQARARAQARAERVVRQRKARIEDSRSRSDNLPPVGQSGTAPYPYN